MKVYEGKKHNVIVDGEDISIFNTKKNITKTNFMFSDVNKLIWQEPTDSILGMLILHTGKQHIVQFSSDSRNMFLELRDLISQKSGIEFQIQTAGSQAFDTAKTGLKALFWLGLGIALFLSAMHNLFGIFG